jgi:hypothetical protein
LVFVAPNLVFVALGLDFVASAFDFVAPRLDIVAVGSARGEPRRGEGEGDGQERQTRRGPLPEPPVETLERSAQGREGVKSSLLRDDKIAGWNSRERVAQGR